MDELAKRILQDLTTDFPHYAEKCLLIRAKDGLRPFVLNKAQRIVHGIVENQKRATGKVRIISLKGRQVGFSTYVEGRYYWRVSFESGMRAFILTHDHDATTNLFDMASRFYDNCPAIIRPALGASNAKELIFSALDSGYRIGTAGNKAVGRSQTIQLLHGSEVAFWPRAEEHAKGILQAVPNLPGTEIFLESTANGIGNWFHTQWQMAESGESEYIPVFLPWFIEDSYRITPEKDFKCTDEEEELKAMYKLDDAQIKWRRLKISENNAGIIDGLAAFKQEYPCNPTEAFQTSGDASLINPSLVMRARRPNVKVEKYGPLIVGVDPARYGSDRTAIIRRRTRCAYGLERYVKKDVMEVTGIVHRIIVEERPTRVLIDIGGLGCGVYDRLCELGHQGVVVGVNSASCAYNQKRFINKRAEMWVNLLEWLKSYPCQIPDEDSLHADLCAPRYGNDSNDRVKLEKKEDMKRRGIRSPDEAEALALTFALPDMAVQESRKRRDEEIAQSIGLHTAKIEQIRKAAYNS